MLPNSIILALIIATFSYADGQSCSTPKGVPGNCISVNKCEPLLTLVNKKAKTPEEFDLLKKSFCGYDNNIPKVCCSKNCTTAEGNSGECINIYSCPHLADLLRPPVLDNNVLYVKQTRCSSADQYSVCCGPPPIGNCGANNSSAPPDPRTECCGDSLFNSRLINGPVSYIDQFPWLAIIEYKQKTRTELLCGGALISRKYVLTAAKCVAGGIVQQGPPTNIRLGEYDIANEGKDCVPDDNSVLDCTDGAVIIPIESTIVHPEYNPKQRRHDIALIRMMRPAPYTDFIRPICLPTSDITLSPPSRLVFHVAGWALNNMNVKTYKNQNANLQYQSLEKCQAAYKNSTEIWKGQICAGSSQGKDTCKGDIGGPLIYSTGRFAEIAGVTSFQPIPCDNKDIPGVYTQVFMYVDWIKFLIEP